MKTTNKDFIKFKDYFAKYQSRFGLNNYQIYFEHKRINKAYANITVNEDGHAVTVRLGINWDDREINSTELQNCALHECVHLLINKLMWLGQCRYLDELEITNEVEGLTVRITNILKK